jgi:type IV pilus assembly protein PilM
MFFRSKATVGLDIGSSLVKAVQLKKTGRSIELEKFGLSEIFPSGEKPKDAAGIRGAKIEAARRALSNAGITAKNAVSAVSGESIIVRYIQLPDMPESELQSALRWEAEEYIPFRIEDVNLDSVVLGRSEAAGATKVDVLLVSAKKDMVEQHLDIVRETGLNPMVLDVDSFAFLNCYEFNHDPAPSEVAALVNIGAGITNINIYVGGVSRFSRDISIAGNTITAAIQSRLGNSYAEAEDIKVSEGAPKPERESVEAAPAGSSLIDTIRGAVEHAAGKAVGESTPEAVATKAIRNTLSNLIGEIQRSIQFFENQGGGKAVQKIVLGGGTSRMKRIDQFFQTEMKLPVEIINPLAAVNPTGPGLDPALVNSARELLGVGIGLALRGVME